MLFYNYYTLGGCIIAAAVLILIIVVGVSAIGLYISTSYNGDARRCDSGLYETGKIWVDRWITPHTKGIIVLKKKKWAPLNSWEWIVSSPDPTLCEGKGSGDFGQFSWFGRLWARTLTRLPLNKAQTWLVSSAAWVIPICTVGNGAFTFLRLASHMTEIKLRFDWHAEIPLRVVKKTKLSAQSHQTPFLVRGVVWARD